MFKNISQIIKLINKNFKTKDETKELTKEVKQILDQKGKIFECTIGSNSSTAVIGQGSFGQITLISNDVNAPKNSGGLMKFCNTESKKCIIKKLVRVTTQEEKDSMDNEINILSILSSLPEKYSRYFIKIKGVQEVTLDNNSNDDNDDFDDDLGMGFYNEGLTGGDSEKYSEIYMEYGKMTLKNYLSFYTGKNNIGIDKLIVLMISMAKCVTILHACGFCHYDLKPDNMIVDLDGDGNVVQMKLIDFGTTLYIVDHIANIIKKVDEKYKPFPIESSIYRGTKTYMAPEVAYMCPPTFSSDVWSLGIMFIQIITNNKYTGISNQINGDNKSNIASKIVNERLKEICPDLNIETIEQISSVISAMFRYHKYPDDVECNKICRQSNIVDRITAKGVLDQLCEIQKNLSNVPQIGNGKYIRII